MDERTDELGLISELARGVEPADADAQHEARAELLKAIQRESRERARPGGARWSKRRGLALLAALILAPGAVAVAAQIESDITAEITDEAGNPVGVDPSACPDAADAFEKAGVDSQPTVYPDRCPTRQELEERLIPLMREFDRARDRGFGGAPELSNPEGER